MPWPAMIARAKNTASTELIYGLDILGFCAARCTVPRPTPISRAMSAQDRPCSRNSTTLAVSTATRGRPMPLALSSG